jgi:phage FluMu protein Com
MPNGTYDRIEFRCGKCHRLGVITGVLLNLTEVLLEGGCPKCGSVSSPYSVDRAHVDRWLKDEVDSPDLVVN